MPFDRGVEGFGMLVWMAMPSITLMMLGRLRRPSLIISLTTFCTTPAALGRHYFRGSQCQRVGLAGTRRCHPVLGLPMVFPNTSLL